MSVNSRKRQKFSSFEEGNIKTQLSFVGTFPTHCTADWSFHRYDWINCVTWSLHSGPQDMYINMFILSSSRFMYLCSINHSICSFINFFEGKNMFLRISTSSVCNAAFVIFFLIFMIFTIASWKMGKYINYSAMQMSTQHIGLIGLPWVSTSKVILWRSGFNDGGNCSTQWKPHTFRQVTDRRSRMKMQWWEACDRVH